MLRKLARAVAVLVALGVLGLAALFGLLWWEHWTPLTLPAPSGHFVVGRTTFSWINNSETDALAPAPGTKRQVLVWLWYPAAASSSSRPAEYLPASWQAAQADYSGVLLTDFLTRENSRVRVHSIADAEVSSERAPYPVVLMRAGSGAFTTDYTTVAEDLASHGYFVVGFDAPYRTFVFVQSDGSVVRRQSSENFDVLGGRQLDQTAAKLLAMWVDDTKFVTGKLQELNAGDPTGKFNGRLDMQHVGMFGHSFGGAQAMQFCHEDDRCRAAIDIDGIVFGSVVQDGLKKPGMILLSDHSREASDPSSKEVHDELESIYVRLPSGLFVTFRGANHFSFSDQILLKSRFLIAGLTALHVFGHLGPRRGLAITADYVHAFFDVYLKGVPRSQVVNLSAKYPEVQSESH